MKSYKTKSWYTIDGAVRRLTETLGEAVQREDLLQLVVEDKLPITCYLRQRPAFRVAPVTNLYNQSEAKCLDELRRPVNFSEPPIAVLSLQKLDNSVQKLEGPFQLRIDYMGWVKDYIFGLISGIETDLMSLDGFLVSNDDDQLFQIIERFEGKSGESVDHYYPSIDLPAENELGFKRGDLEAFEAELLPTSDELNDGPKTRERNNLLRVVYALVSKHYKYDPKAQRSDVPMMIKNLVDLEGIQLGEETIRKFLRKAAQLASDDKSKAN